jgi:hypothetical protein
LPTSRSECDPAGPAAIASYADALSRHVSSTRLAAVQQNVSEAAAQFDSSDCDLARYAKQIPIELIGKPVLDADRLNPRERVARVPDAPLTLGPRFEPWCAHQFLAKKTLFRAPHDGLHAEPGPLAHSVAAPYS